VEERISYKILPITYKVLNDIAPDYLKDLLHKYKPARSLRSASQNNLVIPKTKLSTYGDRAFAAIAPKLWNILPNDLKSANSIELFKTV
jgi:hypothetical protein